MIRGLIFDCFGVLYVGSLQYLRELSPPDKQAELTDLSHASDHGFVSKEDYLRQVSDIIGKSEQETDELISRAHVRNDQLVDYVRSLKPHYAIGLLSNVGEDVVERLFTASERAELFDAVVLSNQENVIKPTAEIFRLTAERLGLPVEECVMIDDLPVNIEGATAAGMQGIVYSSIRQIREDLRLLGVAS